MRRHRNHDPLEDLLAVRGRMLLGAAVLMTGSREAGEDLFQQALERVLGRWHRIEGDPEGYLRRTMYNLATDRWRRLERRQEVLGTESAQQVGDHSDAVDLRDALIRALSELSVRQRTVLVLRYWEGHSEAEVANLLCCSVGTVKSTASRALRRIREISGADLVASNSEGRS